MKTRVKLAFAAAVMAVQATIAGAFGLAAAGEDANGMEKFGYTTMAAGTSIGGGLAGGLGLGLLGAAGAGLVSRARGDQGFEGLAGGIVLGTAGAALGYATGSIAGPVLAL